MAVLNLAPLPLVRQESYREYEYQADLTLDAKAYFNAAELSCEHLVAIESGDKIIKFALIDAAPTETLIYNNEVMYPDAFPNVDLRYALDAGTLKEDIIIKTAQARHSFSFDLQQDNVTADLQPDNSIQYLDIDGSLVWKIVAPYAYDAENKPVSVTLDFTGKVYTVTAVPDENTVFPVILDPTVSLSIPSGYQLAYQGYAGAITKTMGPARFEVGKLGYPNLVSKVKINCTRYIKSPTAVVTSYQNNSHPDNQAWFQWLDKTGAALTEKQELHTNYGNVDLPTPEGAYYFEYTGVCNGSTQTDGVWQAQQNMKVIGIEFDGDKSSSWEVPYSSTTPDSGYVGCRFSLSTKDCVSTHGAVIGRSLLSAPGYFISTSAFNVTNGRTTNVWLDPAYVNAYNAAGELISSFPIPPLATAGNKVTSVTPPAKCSRLEFTGTVNISGTPTTTDTGSLSGSTGFYTPSAQVYVLQISKDVTDARAAIFQPLFSAVPLRVFTSLNDQSHYVEDIHFTAQKNDVVYVKITKGIGDATINAKVAGICIITIAEQFAAAIAADLKRLVTAGQELLPDTLRSTVLTRALDTDTQRQTLSQGTTAHDTVRKTSETASLISDLACKITTSLLLNIDTARRNHVTRLLRASTRRPLTITACILSNSYRFVTNSLGLLTDTKRRITSSVWANKKTAEIRFKVTGRNRSITITSFKD